MNYTERVRDWQLAKLGRKAYYKESVARLLEELVELHEELLKERPNAEAILKEMADVEFTMRGLCVTTDWDLDKAFDLVCESNFTKPSVSAGKVPKGEGYVKPDMTEALVAVPTEG